MDNSQIINSIEKGIKVLEYLYMASDDLSITEISNQFGINKTTIYRILRTYMAQGYIKQDLKTERYRPTMKILTLGNYVLNRLETRSVADRYLKDLAHSIGQSVHLAIIDRHENVIIDKVGTQEAIGINFHIGRRSPLYCTGTGKVFLASMPDSELQEYLTNIKFQQFTPSTHYDPVLLVQEIEEIRRQGYAIDRQEHNIGISCIAAPILDYSNTVIASISITGPSFKIENSMDSLRDCLLQTATAISSQLGHSFNKPSTNPF